MPLDAILARATVRHGKAGPYLAALEPCPSRQNEPGTLLYAARRSADDPEVSWTTEIYADDAIDGQKAVALELLGGRFGHQAEDAA